MRWLQLVEDKPARRRGRPAKYDWDAFWIEAVLLPDGLPDTQAEFEKLMAAWFEKETGDSPSISQIRERAAKLYAQKADK